VANISRKELKKDEFQQEVAQSVGYVVEHRNQVIGLAVLAVALGAGLAFYFAHSRTQRIEARKALQHGIELYHGRVDTEERPGIITFTTSIERRNRTTEAFDLVKNEYGSTPEAQTAEYYLALLDVEQPDYPKAQERLTAVIAKADDETAALARVALAETYRTEGKIEEARQQYQHLIDHPTTLVPKERAQLALARALATEKPDEAKQILNQLVQQPGAVGNAANAALNELFGS
jgi:tetratricopeptide (TPR) repeat protein